MKCCGVCARPPMGSWLVIPLICIFVLSSPVVGSRFGVGSSEQREEMELDELLNQLELMKLESHPEEQTKQNELFNSGADKAVVPNDEGFLDRKNRMHGAMNELVEHPNGLLKKKTNDDDHDEDHDDDHDDDHYDGPCFVVDDQLVNNSGVNDILADFDEDGDGNLNHEEFDNFYNAAFDEGDDGHDAHRRRSTKKNSQLRKTLLRFGRSLRQQDDHDDHGDEDEDEHDDEHDDHTEECESSDQLFEESDLDENGLLSPDELLVVSSDMIMMVVDGCGHHGDDICEGISTGDAWKYGMLSVFGISMISVIGILLIPIHNKRIRNILINALVSFAVGTLVGDVILHILPEIFGVHSHGGPEEEEEDEHEEGTVTRIQWLGLTVCAGIVIFMVIDLTIHFIQHRFRTKSIHRQHAASGDVSKKHPCPDCDEVLPPCRTCDGTNEAADKGHAALEHDGADNCEEPSPVRHSQLNTENEGDSPRKTKSTPKLIRRASKVVGLDEKRKKYSEIKTIGWLNLFSDGIHNFIDGITLGVAWATSVDLGVATTVAVILHEVPQELGDFGILVHAGFTKWQAILWNLASALLAILGCIIGLAVGTSSDAAVPWLLAIAAGGFLYIALTSMLPEVVQNIFRSVLTVVLSLFCVSLGFAIMFIIAVYEIESDC
eukprot:CAMPEP_0201504232 /NCGR_PEP_ID=MMETSP0151_2-20130828/85095_1 /ASSEMBLY_ACC=CAM_ASM_000257 /TAXON_ID=200890 /ORGANISM="Paramoeba atlantica, Strain 621/1 / CCAP 1560/9" /LENGTH=661 /DNA_ID=CAMNT_0047897957 /DNA_START=463 /DNA_END=2448 /DNA_ORIENTATION=+